MKLYRDKLDKDSIRLSLKTPIQLLHKLTCQLRLNAAYFAAINEKVSLAVGYQHTQQSSLSDVR